jgi:hypothetical protein
MRWPKLKFHAESFIVVSPAWILCLLTATAVLAQQPTPPASATPPPLSAEQVVTKLQQRNQERAVALRQFQSTRIYRIQYHGFPSNRDAEMVVKMEYQSPAKKEFTLISQTGSQFVIDHVLKKLLEGEREATDAENQRRTALTADNYDFQMDGYENTSSGPQYVLQVIPKSHNKYLYRGKIWVDAKDFAVTQMEGKPAKNPSVWIKKTQIEQKYEKIDSFWLPEQNRTESVVRLGGRAILTIDYKDYKIIEAGPIISAPDVSQTTAVR